VELEAGGVIKMMWAFDLDSGPLHTYRANMDDVGDKNSIWEASRLKAFPDQLMST
jgi:hypothetical protein